MLHEKEKNSEKCTTNISKTLDMQVIITMKAATQMPIQQVIGKERISRSFPIITAKAVSLKRIEKLVKTKSGVIAFRTIFIFDRTVILYLKWKNQSKINTIEIPNQKKKTIIRVSFEY